MKTKEKLIKEKEEIEKQLKELEEKEKLKDFKEIRFKNKIFKIYKWENKPHGDLINNLPKNERLATFQEFNKLIEEKVFEMELYKVYVTKHFNKLQWDKKYCLSRLCLNDDLGLYSDWSNLDDSGSDGRVVVVRDLK